MQPEFAHAYDVFAQKMDVVVASPNGGEAPLDAGSIKAFGADPSCANFLENHTGLWKNTEKLSGFVGRAGEFDALFFVGGHGRELLLAFVSRCKAAWAGLGWGWLICA